MNFFSKLSSQAMPYFGLLLVVLSLTNTAITYADAVRLPPPEEMPEGAAQLVQNREVKLSIWKKLPLGRAHGFVSDDGHMKINIQMPGPCDYEYMVTNCQTGDVLLKKKGAMDNLNFIPVSKCATGDPQKGNKYIKSTPINYIMDEFPNFRFKDNVCYYDNDKFDFRILDDTFHYNPEEYEKDKNFLVNAKFTLYDYEYVDDLPHVTNKSGKTLTFERYITITASTCDVYHFDRIFHEKIIDLHQEYPGLYDASRSLLRRGALE